MFRSEKKRLKIPDKCSKLSKGDINQIQPYDWYLSNLGVEQKICLCIIHSLKILITLFFLPKLKILEFEFSFTNVNGLNNDICRIFKVYWKCHSYCIRYEKF